jgi:dTDP-4-dehydrorhamnose reductase
MASKPVIIATGLSGMVGSRFSELFNDDFSFVNLDLSQGIDITDSHQVDRILSAHQPTSVIHLAAFTDVSRAYQEKGDKNGLVYRVNTLGSKNIAQACRKHRHYLIHISTDFVFDGQKTTAYTETDQPNPIEWYGQTKLWAEQEVEQSGCRFVIARLSFPFRARFEPKKDLVRNIIDKLKNNSLYPMFTDQVITPTFIDDICQALKVFINQQPSGIYHLVGSTSISPYDLAQKIAQVFNLQADIKKGSFKEYLTKDPRPRQQYLKLSNAKLKKDFNISMKTIDSALEELKNQMS